MWADGDTSESPLTIFYLVSLSFQFPQNRKRQCCSIVLSFDNNNTINLSAATTGFIFPNDHSQQQQQQQQSRPRIYSDPQNPNLFLSASPGLEMEMREVGDNLLLAVPTPVDQRLRRMGFYLLIHWGGSFQMRLGTIDNTTTSTMTRTLQVRLVKVLKILLDKVYVPVSIQDWYNHFCRSKATEVRLDPYFPF